MESNSSSPATERFGARRVEEARAELKKANKALKTGLFKWSADYDAASRAFEAAATRFNMANLLVEAKDAFVSAAECKMKSEHPSAYFAAKHLESAAGCSHRLSADVDEMEQKVRLVDEAAQLMMEAAERYQESNHVDRTIDCYSKAAKFCHEHRVDRALMTYHKMVLLCNQVDPGMVAMLIDFVRDAIGFVCGQRSFDVALELLHLHKKWCLHLGQSGALNRVCASTVIVYLVAGQGDAALNSFNESMAVCGDFGESPECEQLREVMAAIGRKSQSELETAKANAARFRSLDREVYQLAMSLNVDSADLPRMPGDTYEEFVADSGGEVDLTGLEAPSVSGAADDEDDLC